MYFILQRESLVPSLKCRVLSRTNDHLTPLSLSQWTGLHYQEYESVASVCTQVSAVNVTLFSIWSWAHFYLN